MRGEGDVVLQRDALGWMNADLGGVDVALTQLDVADDGAVWVVGQTGLFEVLPPGAL